MLGHVGSARGAVTDALARLSSDEERARPSLLAARREAGAGVSLTALLRIRRTDRRSIGSVVLAMRRAWAFHQFGQANDSRTNNGATGCTDTCLQLLILLVKGVWYTHDRIRGIVGHRNPYTGLSYAEVSAIATSLRLNYRVELGLTYEQIVSLVRTRGPVMIGEPYGWHPSWRGFRYMGRVASSYPNGFAKPWGKAGRTQLGPNFRHAVVILAIGTLDGVQVAYVFEPNHNSPARGEDPPYDVLTMPQLRKLIDTYRAQNGQTYALHPTRPITVAA